MIHVNSFVKRQTPDSEFSHFTGPWGELVELVEKNLNNYRSGYRRGVILVPVPPTKFMSAIRTLREGDKLTGEFKARAKGEAPRKSVRVAGDKSPAKSAFIVLYSSNVLAEDGSNELPLGPEGPAGEQHWEIISINASPQKGDIPINPDTLMHNHFGSSGGTATNMTDGKFVAALKESFLYWKNKELVRPND